jgi:hypothetical protein
LIYRRARLHPISIKFRLQVTMIQASSPIVIRHRRHQHRHRHPLSHHVVVHPVYSCHRLYQKSRHRSYHRRLIVIRLRVKPTRPVYNVLCARN